LGTFEKRGQKVPQEDVPSKEKEKQQTSRGKSARSHALKKRTKKHTLEKVSDVIVIKGFGKTGVALRKNKRTKTVATTVLPGARRWECSWRMLAKKDNLKKKEPPQKATTKRTVSFWGTPPRVVKNGWGQTWGTKNDPKVNGTISKMGGGPPKQKRVWVRGVCQPGTNRGFSRNGKNEE